MEYISELIKQSHIHFILIGILYFLALGIANEESYICNYYKTEKVEKRHKAFRTFCFYVIATLFIILLYKSYILLTILIW